MNIRLIRAKAGRSLRFLVTSLLIMAFSALSAMAQSPSTATLRGQVTDQNGGAIAGATIVMTNSVTGLRREVQTDDGGYYAIPALPLTGDYHLAVSNSNFAPTEINKVGLQAGETATINVTLKAQGTSSEVTVYGTDEGVRSDSPQVETRLDLAKIDNTPIVGRKMTSLALLDSAVRNARGTGDLFLDESLIVIDGSGRRQTNFLIDGATGDDAWGRQTIFTDIPLAALQEFTILPNAFSAQYGRSTGSAINVVTKSGTNTLHGDLLGLWRPGGIQARNPGAPAFTPDRLDQFSGALSGPIVQNRTQFFVAGEYNRENRDSAVTSTFAPQIFTGHFRQGLFLARIDHQINDKNSLSARVNFDRFTDSNPQDVVGGNTLPSAGRIFARKTYTAELSETSILSSAAVNEARFQYQIGSPITQFTPVSPSLQIVRPGLVVLAPGQTNQATEGESRPAFLSNHQFELSDNFSFTRQRHEITFGGDGIHSSSGGNSQEFGTGFLLGQFTLKPNDTTPDSALTIADVARFTQTFGNQSYNVKEWLWAVFAEDDIKLRSDLTLNLGLRYERQTFTDGKHNFGPRVGFAYNFRGDKRTVIHGGYGIFYSEIRANLAATYNIGGPTGVFTFTATPGQLGFPTSIAPLPAFPAGVPLPARVINVRPGQAAFLSQFFDITKLTGYPSQLLNPYTQMATFGVSREFGDGWILTADYSYQRTIRIDRPIDLNAPAPFIRTAPGQTRSGAAADASRPIPAVANGFSQIVTTINQGESYYNGLHVNLTKRLTRNLSMLLSYTYSHTIDNVEPDGTAQTPNEVSQLSQEWGSSIIDQRHRAVLSGSYQLPAHFLIGAVASLGSGRPYNITTGADNNGDGSNSDRPVVNGQILGRDTGKGTPLYDVAPFAERQFNLGGDRFRLNLRAEAFNVFNHANIVGRNGTFGNGATPLATLGLPLAGVANVEPGRQFQFTARLRF